MIANRQMMSQTISKSKLTLAMVIAIAVLLIGQAVTVMAFETGGFDTQKNVKSALDNSLLLVGSALNNSYLTVEKAIAASGWVMVPEVPEQPEGMYTGGGTSFPGGPEIQTFATGTRIPYVFWVTVLAFGTEILAGVGVFLAMSSSRMGRNGSLFVMWLTVTVVLVVWYIGGGGVIPGWVLIPPGVWGVFLMLWFNPFKSAAG